MQVRGPFERRAKRLAIRTWRLALADDSEPRILERLDCLKVGDARELGHYTATSTSRTSAPVIWLATTERYS